MRHVTHFIRSFLAQVTPFFHANRRLYTQRFCLLVVIGVATWAGLAIRSASVPEYNPSLPVGSIVWGQDLSGLSWNDAERVLDNMTQQRLDQPLSVTLSMDEGDVLRTVRLGELGVSYDLPQTLDHLVRSAGSYGTAEIFFSTTRAQMEARLPVVHFDHVIYERFLDTVLRSYERPVRDAQLRLVNDNNWGVVPSQTGVSFSDEESQRFQQLVLQVAQETSLVPRIQVGFDVQRPQIYAQDLESLRNRLNDLMQVVVHWDLEGDPMSFTLRDHVELLQIHPEQSVVSFQEDLLDEYLDSLAMLIEREAAVTLVSSAPESDTVLAFLDVDTAFRPGLRLDREVFRSVLLKALDEAKGSVSVELPLVFSASSLRSDAGESLTLLAEGRSSFQQGNDPARVHNIRFGLEKYNGLVIPAGAEFSFNEILGSVTSAAGWKSAAAIFGGGGVRPVPGGGLCQVSTTMFRAALWGGLPITQRKPHSLDVSYYHAYGYGLDSTVYPPENIDLAFVNDTPGPLVIRTSTTSDLEAVVQLYGVDDGRSVELAQKVNEVVPRQSNVVTYTDDITRGFQELLSRGRDGRYIEWDWTVTRADGSVDERVVETLYPPSRRRVRIGTGPALLSGL